MTPCLSVDQLLQLLADSLPDLETEAVEAHAASCAHCQQALERLASREWVAHSASPKEGTIPLCEIGNDEAFLRRLEASPPWAKPVTPNAPSEGATSAGDQPALHADGAAGEPTQYPQVAGYEVLGLLGTGGMGAVYKARHLRLNRLVALKMVLAGKHARPADLLRFRIEAEAVAALTHPNIVPVHEVGEADGCPYLALEYVEGGTLGQRLRGGPFAALQAAELVRLLAAAMDYAHRRGVIHRDLKPANVLLTADGKPKITDFGLAKRLGAAEGQTATGEVVGTPSYMAPEQAQSRTTEIGPATDVYALGAILYDLLTGRPPFEGATPLETLVHVTSREPVPPSRLRPRVPRDLETICLKCLAKEPAKRYASAEALAEDLRRFLADEPILSRPTSRWERAAKWVRRQPALAALVGVLCTATVIVTALLVRHELAVREANTRLESVNSRLETENERAGRLLHAARVRLAQHALQVGQIGRAVELLDICRPAPGSPRDFRGIEWYHLWQLCHRERSTFCAGKDETLLPILAPDERTLAIRRGDKVILRDLYTGEEHKPLTYQRSDASRDIYWTAAFSPKGDLMVTASDELHLWDLATGGLMSCLKKYSPNPAERVTTVAIAPDGRTLAAGQEDGSVTVWDLLTRDCRFKLRSHKYSAPLLVFDSRGQRLITMGRDYWDTTAVAWDMEAGGQQFTWRGSDTAWVTDAAFAPDGRVVAFAEGHLFNFALAGRVELRDAATFRLLTHVPIPSGGAFAVAFSPDGQTLATGTNHGLIKLWDLIPEKDGISLRERRTLHGHSGRVNRLAFSADGRTLFSLSHDNTLKQWDALTEPEPLVLNAPLDHGPLRHRGQLGGVLASAPLGLVTVLPSLLRGPEAASPFYSLAFAPDGQTLAAGGDDGTVVLWDVASRRVRNTFRGSDNIDAKIAISPQGDLLATPTPKNTVTLYEISTGRVRATLRGHQAQVTAVAFSPDGRMLATGSVDKTVKLWDVLTGTELRTLEGHKHVVFALVFAPEGRRLASGGDDKTVRIWDVAGGSVLHTFTEEGLAAAMAIAFDDKGQRLAVGYYGTNMAVWDMETKKRLPFFRGHMGAVQGVAFLPGEDTLVTAGRDGTVRIWDLMIQEERLALPDQADIIYCLAVAPGAEMLATAGRDGTVRLWHAPRVPDSSPK